VSGLSGALLATDCVPAKARCGAPARVAAAEVERERTVGLNGCRNISWIPAKYDQKLQALSASVPSAETLSVLGSTNDSTFTQIVASAGYTGWDAGQISEPDVYLAS
jgi:hypothetical protein